MMKKICSTIATFAMMIAALGIIACGGDDDDVDNGGGINTPQNGKRLSKIILPDDDLTLSFEFVYDNQGRVVRYDILAQGRAFDMFGGGWKDVDDKDSYEVLYNESFIAVSNIVEYYLEKGLIVKSQENNKKPIYYVYENNCLVKSISGNDSIKYIWSDGNIVKTEHYERASHTRDVIYEYSTYKDNYGFDIFCIYGNYYLFPFGAMGFWGKRSNNLISRVIEIEYYEENYFHEASQTILEKENYEWVIKDGLPVSLNHNSTSKSTFYFEWE